MTVILKERNIKINNPSLIVLAPEYVVVRVGEKEDMEKEYESILERIDSYDDSKGPNETTLQVLNLLKQYGFDFNPPTKKEVLELKNDYRLIHLNDNQEEFDNIMNITGYLKKYFKDEN